MSNRNEWGEDTKDESTFNLERNGLISCIQKNNPAVTSASTSLESDEIDWEAAGRCVGNSTCLKTFSLSLSNNRERIKKFCKGLALNKSIEDFSLDYGHNHDEYDRCFNIATKCLLPFVLNNKNLVEFRIYVRFQAEVQLFPPEILTAIQTNPFLRTVHIHGEAPEEFFKAICRKQPGLQHISISDAFLSNECSTEIKNMLCDKNCVLKSLSLQSVNVTDEAVSFITTGLSQNKSVKCFRFHTYHFETLRSLFTALRDSPLTALEIVQIVGPSPDNQTMGPMWAGEVKQLPMLKSLDLSDLGYFADFSSWQSIFSTVLSSTSNLCDLNLTRMVRESEILEELGRWLGKNTTLKVLNISFHRDLEPWDWAEFFNAAQTSMLEQIDLRPDEYYGYSGVPEVFALNRTLRTLITTCYHRDEGEQLFSMLASEINNVEEVDISFDSGDFADLLVDVFCGSSRLKRLSLSVSDDDKLQMIPSALELPGCSLEVLNIVFDDEEFDLPLDVTRMFVNALRANSTLKILQMTGDYRVMLHGSLELSMWLNLLCNKSSIDATYHSNHTLQSIDFTAGYSNLELDLLLYANRDTNKHAVARKKILDNHTLENVNFTLPSLPHALSWVGNADIDDGLSRLYGILRRVPHIMRT